MITSRDVSSANAACCQTRHVKIDQFKMYTDRLQMSPASATATAISIRAGEAVFFVLDSVAIELVAPQSCLLSGLDLVSSRRCCVSQRRFRCGCKFQTRCTSHHLYLWSSQSLCASVQDSHKTRVSASPASCPARWCVSSSPAGQMAQRSASRPEEANRRISNQL